jgi:protein tyrosine phosphatase (PTP) superfamily phosphohydrolase (DUF442 family)
VILISSRPSEELSQVAKAVGADATVNKADLRAKFVPAIEAAVKRRMRGLGPSA